MFSAQVSIIQLGWFHSILRYCAIIHRKEVAPVSTLTLTRLKLQWTSLSELGRFTGDRDIYWSSMRTIVQITECPPALYHADRAGLNWSELGTSNATDTLREWQFVDVTGHNGLHRCCLVLYKNLMKGPDRTFGESWVKGLCACTWSYKLMIWDACGQPAVFQVSCLLFQQTKNIGHVFLFLLSRCPVSRGGRSTDLCAVILGLYLICVISTLCYELWWDAHQTKRCK